MDRALPEPTCEAILAVLRGVRDGQAAPWTLDTVIERLESLEPATNQGAACLTVNEAALLETLARREIAKHEHTPHALLSARDKLIAHPGRGR